MKKHEEKIKNRGIITTRNRETQKNRENTTTRTHFQLKSCQKICDNSTNTTTIAKSNRSLGNDLFTILIIVYHMVQWLKVTRIENHSCQDED